MSEKCNLDACSDLGLVIHRVLFDAGDGKSDQVLVPCVFIYYFYSNLLVKDKK